MSLTREAILQADDATRESVDVPEWGGSLFVRVMDGKERDAFENWFLQARETKNYVGFRARLTAATACDDSGVLLFKPDDIPALELKSSSALQRVYDAAMRLNRMSKDDQDDLEKNLEATTANSSSSDSL